MTRVKAKNFLSTICSIGMMLVTLFHRAKHKVLRQTGLSKQYRLGSDAMESDHSLHCWFQQHLPLIQQFLDTPADNKINLFKFKTSMVRG